MNDDSGNPGDSPPPAGPVPTTPSATPSSVHLSLRSRPSTWKVLLAACLLFLGGVGVGVAASALVAIRLVRSAVHPEEGKPTPADRMLQRVAADLQTDLNLTPDESRVVRRELRDLSAQIRRSRQRALDDVRVSVRTTIRRITVQLPPEKRKLFVDRVRDRLQVWRMLDLLPPGADRLRQGEDPHAATSAAGDNTGGGEAPPQQDAPGEKPEGGGGS